MNMHVCVYLCVCVVACVCVDEGKVNNAWSAAKDTGKINRLTSGNKNCASAITLDWKKKNHTHAHTHGALLVMYKHAWLLSIYVYCGKQTQTRWRARAANGLRVVCVMCLMKLTALAVSALRRHNVTAKGFFTIPNPVKLIQQVS